MPKDAFGALRAPKGTFGAVSALKASFGIRSARRPEPRPPGAVVSGAAPAVLCAAQRPCGHLYMYGIPRRGLTGLV